MRLLGISRATFFRKINDGVLRPPQPATGTKRRWWTQADIALAREELRMKGEAA